MYTLFDVNKRMQVKIYALQQEQKEHHDILILNGITRSPDPKEILRQFWMVLLYPIPSNTHFHTKISQHPFKRLFLLKSTKKTLK